jgi:hypothetical protein
MLRRRLGFNLQDNAFTAVDDLEAAQEIVKVSHSHRWHVSKKGHQVLGAVVRLYHHGIPAAMGIAA